MPTDYALLRRAADRAARRPANPAAVLLPWAAAQGLDHAARLNAAPQTFNFTGTQIYQTEVDMLATMTGRLADRLASGV